MPSLVPQSDQLTGGIKMNTTQAQRLLKLLIVVVTSVVGLAAISSYRSAVLVVDTAVIDAAQSEVLRINAPIAD